MPQSFRKLFSFSLILLISLEASQIFGQSIRFNHLMVENGLSNNNVNTVIQDQIGFMWFATEDGLNRYDGYSFKIFRHEPGDSNSISDNSIWTLTEDSKGNIWIGTKAGVLNKYDPVYDRFTRWKIKSRITAENSITAIFEDSNGYIWIGTYKEGLYKLDLSTNKFYHWASNPEDEKSLSHNYIRDIIEDTDGNIIVATYIGLNKFNPEIPQYGFERYFFNSEDRNSLSDNLIWSLSPSNADENIIWVCTFNNLTKFDSRNSTFERIIIDNPDNLQYGTSVNSVVEEIVDREKIIWTASYSGLIRMNLNTGSTYRFVHNENNLQSLSSNQINKIIKDQNGVLWLATENGISYVTPKSTLFNTLGFSSTDFNISTALKQKNITAICKLTSDKICIGTVNGLYSVENLETSPKLSYIPYFAGHHIWSLESTKRNEIWIGTFGKGLMQFNFNNHKITKWNLSDPKIRTQSVYYNRTLFADSKQNIWVGYWGVGAARINQQTGNSEVWLNENDNPLSISHNDVWVIKEDQLGRIWLGTVGGGLNLFEDTNGGVFHHWLESGDDQNSLSSNNIYSICVASNLKDFNDSETVLWLGTSNGLNRFEIQNRSKTDDYDIEVKVQSYKVSDGLPDNSVNSIIEDENGNLWLGTGSGISFFNVYNKSFTNFSSADGINGTVMNPESALQIDNDLILFGSTEGLNMFDPGNITLSTYEPNIVITDFQIFNNSVTISENSPLAKNISSTNKIVLSHDKDVLSFEFAALDYNSSESIKYAYKMEGFDKDWIESGTRRFVTYTNLDPGEYVFKVKSTNADGVWCKNEVSLSILMTPPWWRTVWAYGLYVILILVGLVGIRKFEMSRTKLRNELKLKEIEVRNKSELEEVKSRFFANLSHEFRTPLMLIKGPLEQLKESVPDKIFKENIELIERNSDRLKELINQLLELSQLEKATVPLKAKHINLVETLRGLLASFEALAKQKNIELKFESDLCSELFWIDRDKFEKMINNLLSNAFKFTPQGGSVIVSVREILFNERRFAEIKIADSGAGIAKDKIEKIFDRFYQVDSSDKRSYGGSGIGLALVKEFVDLHRWKISVESEEGKGTGFKIQIPIWDDYLNEDEKVYDEPNGVVSNSDNQKSEPELSIYKTNKKQKTQQTENSNNQPLLLIVDDSEDVRKYLSGLLEVDYKISMAENGEEGIKAASEINPDLIISDVMMPLMDGMEFCNKIKSNWQTSDIPVILLTAKATIESKLEGLEIGADAYLTKPFDSKELFVRIKNLLDQRKRIRDKYNQNLDSITESKKLNTADSEFINKAIELLEKNIDKTNFGTEQLAKELFVSRTQLHRKILSITEQAPGEFIRVFKLKRAAQLLLEGKFSVTQVAYEIGFSSPAQFTRAFTKQFDCLPSEFPSNQKKLS